MSKFSDQAISVISTVAPVLGTALGGPLGALAGGLISKALGSATGSSGASAPLTQAQVEKAILGADPSTLLALKQAESDLQKHLADLGVQEDQIAAQDRDSARKREEVVKDWTPRILAFLVVALVIALEGYIVLYGEPKAVNQIVLGRILGTLDAALMLVLSYYFGSSAAAITQQKTISDIAKS